jgi:hypothetical protein
MRRKRPCFDFDAAGFTSRQKSDAPQTGGSATPQPTRLTPVEAFDLNETSGRFSGPNAEQPRLLNHLAHSD